MRIEHIAIWVASLEEMRDFYTRFFGMQSSAIYINAKKGFSSYFLSYESGTRIEIMHRKDISTTTGNKGASNGLTHIAFSVGSKGKVDELTELIGSNGFEIFGKPRTTGDGYYESVVIDPEGNHIEITE